MSKSTAAPAARPSPRILIVEDEIAFASRLAKNLKLDGFSVDIAGDVETALERLAAESHDLVLTDIRMPGRSGLDLIDEIMNAAEQSEATPPPTVVISSIGDIETAVDAMRRGAVDYMTKETSREEITLRLRNALRQSRLATEVRRLRQSLDRYGDFDEIIGASDSIQRLKASIGEVAPSEATVLITGETGVGKELVARAIHKASQRSANAFVEVNCAALPDENLFLSELFGHERGAFTGAISRKRGQFELADGGTLFLDEVGELGASAQARLLRAVETLQFNRLGSERTITVDCRLVFATNKDIEAEVEADRFRRDLFYRINVCPIRVPPLRSRPEDIGDLVPFFIRRMVAKHHLAPIELAEDALESLRANPWPGNVRELSNVIERLSIRFAGKTVGAAQLRELDLSAADRGGVAGMILPEGGVDLLEVEKSLVIQALQRADWSQRKAAGLLGISVDRMNARVRKFGLSHPSWRVHKGA